MTTPAHAHTGLAASGSSDPTSFEAASWIGRTIDERYRIEQLLGQGGMGAVFLAEHVKLQKKVALKVILPQFAGNGEVAERFAREAMASAKLEHPHVASALDYGTLPEGGAYLVMQLARGPSLRKALESGDPASRGWRFACEIGTQIADALAAAHGAAIVHRDLKPENVMLEPREDGSALVKVLDFGIARVLDDAASGSGLTKLTRVGTVIGTPGYMSPEQALGEPVDARADLYALGVILWEVCAGRELWSEAELTALVTKQLTTDAPRLGAVVAEVPPELETLVERLLARDKALRPERASEVQGTLKRLALQATVERMSGTSGSFPIPAGASGAYQAPAAAAAPSATGATFAGARSSLLAALPPPLAARAVQLEERLPPALRTPPGIYAVLGGALAVPLFFALVTWTVCGSGDEGATAVAALPTSVAPAPRPSMPIDPGASDPQATAPRGVEPPPTGAGSSEATPAGFDAIPAELASDFDALRGDASRPRRAAARRILALPEGSVPPVVWQLARLEDAGSCESRAPIVIGLGVLGDPRAISTLERYDRNHRGCGFLRSSDCHRCMRSELRDALSRLRAAAP